MRFKPERSERPVGSAELTDDTADRNDEIDEDRDGCDHDDGEGEGTSLSADFSWGFVEWRWASLAQTWW